MNQIKNDALEERHYKNESFFKRYQSYFPSVIAIVALFLFGQILTPGFASAANVNTIIASASILIVASIGQSFVIFAGDFGIDLSIGAVMSMGAMVTSIICGGDAAYLPTAILFVLFLGGMAGLINGVGVQIMRIPPLAMTLVMATVINGFTLAYTHGSPSLGVPAILQSIGKPLFGQIRAITLIAIIFIIVIQMVLVFSKYGRELFLVGSNRIAARISGIRVNLIIVLAYVISGLVASVAGVLMVGYVGSGQLQMGDQYTLMSVAAVVIGGTKLSGGQGSLVGAALGAIVIVLLTSILIAVGLSAGVRTFFQGVILVLILMVNCRMPKLRA